MIPRFHLALALCFMFILSGFSPAAQAACVNPAGTAGAILYNSDAKAFQYCNNTIWVRMTKPGSGAGGCTNPALAEGKLVYNADSRVLQGCAGNVHLAAGPVMGTNEWVKVSAGGRFSCGIKNDKSLWCWGSNSNGRIGDGSASISISIPKRIADPSTWDDISAGDSHACGVKTDGTLWCWGSNSNGRTGMNTTAGNTTTPVQVNGGGSWKKVSAGYQNTCAIKSDDTLWCLGYNWYGAVGDGTSGAGTDRLVPTAVSGGGSWKEISVGGGLACGIKSDDTLHCWGNHNGGATAQNTGSGNVAVPTQVDGGGTWKQISTSADNPHGCGIKSDDSLWCWGNNFAGQIGDGTTVQKLVPTAVSGGGTWKNVSAGAGLTCAIKSDDTLYCWGSNSKGILGDGTDVSKSIPTLVSAGGFWTGASASKFYNPHSCAIKSNGELYCWGNNDTGQTGDGILINPTGGGTQVNVPTKAIDSSSWKSITGGTGGTACGIKSDDTLWCWGWNNTGAVGDGTSGNDRLFPTSVSGGGTWKQVEGGTWYTCGIKSDNSLLCWGQNANGRTGQNTTAGDTIVPTQVNGGGSWKSLGSSNTNHTCAIKSDDSLWCWGWNNSGQIGDNTSGANRLVPTAINGGGSWKMVSTGTFHSCGIKSDDSLWCWGGNSNGQIGDNTSGTNRLVPTAVSGGGTWKFIDVGGSHSCGIKSDDTVWCWGSNSSGQTGLNTSAGNTLVPTQINGGGTWKMISISATSCGIKSDDTIWCWGSNFSGNLGDGTTTDRLVPTQVTGGGTWMHIANGGGYACALASPSQLYCWGSNSYGQLTALESSSPFHLSGTRSLCSNPAGKAGNIIYNSDFNVLQYCDGVGWVQIGQ